MTFDDDFMLITKYTFLIFIISIIQISNDVAFIRIYYWLLVSYYFTRSVMKSTTIINIVMKFNTN